MLDGCKRPVRGLWLRGSRYHARMAVADFNTGRKIVRRVPLAGADSVAQAVLAYSGARMSLVKLTVHRSRLCVNSATAIVKPFYF